MRIVVSVVIGIVLFIIALALYLTGFMGTT